MSLLEVIATLIVVSVTGTACLSGVATSILVLGQANSREAALDAAVSVEAEWQARNVIVPSSRDVTENERVCHVEVVHYGVGPASMVQISSQCGSVQTVLYLPVTANG